ncbi:MAG: hypothetical protein HFJ09_02975 [Lachnospiraceae bacterium]|nr:hypothetical protein [Lachnospiraceae bacterium]
MFQETECLDDLLELLGNPKVLKRSQWTSDETLEDGTTLKVDNADLKGEETFVQARNARFMAIFSERGIMSVKNTFIMNSFGLYDGAEKNKELASGSYECVCSEIEKFLERQKIENILEPAIYYFSPELLQKVADINYQEFMALEDKNNAEKYKITLGKEDGVYLIRYMQGYKGVPYNYMPIVSNDVDENLGAVGTNMRVEYGKRGIQSISGTEFTGVPVWYLVYGEGVGAKTGTAREVITFNARTGEIYG